jgi:hypothetical protein
MENQLVSCLISLITGGVGGNIAGALLKNFSLGPIGNTIAGVLRWSAWATSHRPAGWWCAYWTPRQLCRLWHWWRCADDCYRPHQAGARWQVDCLLAAAGNLIKPM